MTLSRHDDLFLGDARLGFVEHYGACSELTLARGRWCASGDGGLARAVVRSARHSLTAPGGRPSARATALPVPLSFRLRVQTV